MAKCSLGCGRTLAAGSQFTICETCRASIQRLSIKRRSEIADYQQQLHVRERRTAEILGPRGEGPRAGSYVAQLIVKRRARARLEKQREGAEPRKVQHFPAHAAA